MTCKIVTSDRKMNMVDIHSHLIFGVDDGPATIEESVRMVDAAAKLGVDTIIATPHFHENLFGGEKLTENYQKLLYKTRDYSVSILLGYEVFLNPLLSHMAKNKKNFTLNNSHYLLFELPFNAMPQDCFELVYRLQKENMIPVLAHPERNRNFQRIRKFISFLGTGCLIQLDAASIAGVYGKRVRDFARQLVEMNLVHFVASDAHYAKDYINWYGEAYKSICLWAGEEYADNLFSRNAGVIISQSRESVYEII